MMKKSESENAIIDCDKTDDILKSLRQVNEDDTLSRVLYAEPVTRVLEGEEDSGFSGSPIDDMVKFSEEVTLCGASHVETTMAECISDGIEAADIGSLLEQFQEFEKAISPAMSPKFASFPTPIPSPGETKSSCNIETKSNDPIKKLQKSAAADTPPLTPTETPFIKEEEKEIPECDITIDSQITITTTSSEDDVLDVKADGEFMDTTECTGSNDCGSTTEKECIVVNKNGIVVVEYRDVIKKETDEIKNDDVDNGTDDNSLNIKLKSVISQCYRIPKIPKRSKTRSRSRSPLRRHVSRSRGSSRSHGYSSSSDDEFGQEDRYEKYRSERRTPTRRDDRRKRRKYSSCSDDEYDYYRYSKRSNHRNQSPLRHQYEHDYNKPRSYHKDYYRSNSLRDRSDRSSSHSRHSRKNDYPEDKIENVHERLAVLAAPVPYDIEQERKIGFLVTPDQRNSAKERRNVYAGGIQRDMTRGDLIRRFEAFGPVEKVTLHFREEGDNYAFIVFEDAKDAVRAVKDGNSDPNYKPLDLCFGGRRKFVGGSYVDFDANISYLEENDLNSTRPATPESDLEFDALLAKAKRQKSVNS